MARYQKKPLEVEAVQFIDENADEIGHKFPEIYASFGVRWNQVCHSFFSQTTSSGAAIKMDE